MLEEKLTRVLKGKHDNHLLPFFWQHGEDDETLIREIDAIDQSGIRAVCVESRTHEQFGEDAWWHTMDTIISACKARDMKVWLLDDKHFPSGYANGIIPKKYPERRMWTLTERHLDVVGPQKDAAVMAAWKLEETDETVGIIACRRAGHGEAVTDEVMDLSACVRDGMVFFDVPEGCWRITFLIKTHAGLGGYRDYADKLTPEGGDAFLEAVYEPHWEHYKKEFGKTFVGFFSDEPCFGNRGADGIRADFGKKYTHFPWTDEVLCQLKERFGDRAVSMLPYLWHDGDFSALREIRYAYMDIITALYAKNFTEKLGNWCRAHGVEYIGHIIEDDEQHTGTQDSAGHYFRALDGQDMGGIDVVLCQTVPGMTDYINTVPCSYRICDPDFYHFTLPKLGSSHAHIQARKDGRAMCEIFGAYGWAEGTKMMKWLADLMMVRGINYFVPHAFTPKYPDYDCPPHMYAGGHNPEFPQFRKISDYMNRVCNFISGGKSCPTAAVLYHAEAQWVSGRADSEPVNPVIRALTEDQLDADIISADYLYDAKVKDGTLLFVRTHYPCLIVPSSAYLPEKLLSTLARLEHDGLPVIFMKDVPMPAEEHAVPVTFGDGMHIAPDTAELCSYLRSRGFADVTGSPSDTNRRALRVYHYERGLRNRNDLTHYYFMTNEDIHSPVHAELTLSASHGEECCIYDPMENRVYRERLTDGKLSMTLMPYESRMVIIADGYPCIPMAPKEKLFGTYEVSDPTWKIELSHDGAPFEVFSESHVLINMTGANGKPHFSGRIRYTNTVSDVQCFGDMRAILDLGEVGECAKVEVNGVDCGERIVPPYRFDITDALKDGDNVLTITVTNHFGWEKRDGLSQYLLFEPSGLLGPVRIETHQTL